MKKLKIFPSILMLVLCVGVLVVGAYSITPASNSITGTIVVEAVKNSGVTMTAYKDSITGTQLGSLTTEKGDDLNIGTLRFSMNNVAEVGDVAPIVIVLVFTTTITDNLVIETKNIESFDGITTDGTNKVVNNVVSAKKEHTEGLTDTATKLPAFNKTNSYQITCKLTLNELATQELAVPLKLKFNIYKASEYTAYTTGVVDDKTYYTFGSFPQSQADTTGLTLTDTYTNYMAYDDATGGVAYNDIYCDLNGNEYVDLYDYEHNRSVYYKVEKLKWKQLTNTNGKAMLLCDNILEQVPYYLNLDDRTVNAQTIYANNYMHSTLRGYLINIFYKSAFNSLEMALIPITEVDNSAYTTESVRDNRFECDNTNDCVFALSYQDLLNTNYSLTSTDTRKQYTTAYSVATGVLSSPIGDWWLRSPDYYESSYVWLVVYDGESRTMTTNDDRPGVVPALYLTL